VPCGADQEAAALAARTDVTGALELLLRRCVRSITSSDGNPVDTFSDSLREQLSDRMAELDPQAEIVLHFACPACGAPFRAIFDTASYLMEELKASMRHLYREVHLLAYHYHWSPTEILSLSAGKRWTFLQLLEEEVTEGAPR